MKMMMMVLLMIVMVVNMAGEYDDDGVQTG